MQYVNTYMLKWLFFSVLVGIGGGISALILSTAINQASDVATIFPLWVTPLVGGAGIMRLVKVDSEVLGSKSSKYIDGVNLLRRW